MIINIIIVCSYDYTDYYSITKTIDALLLKNIPTINRYAMYHDNIFAHVLNFGPKLHFYTNNCLLKPTNSESALKTGLETMPLDKYVSIVPRLLSISILRNMCTHVLRA